MRQPFAPVVLVNLALFLVPVNDQQTSINSNETGLYVSTQGNVNTTDFINKLNFYLVVYDTYRAQIDLKPLD